MGDPGKKPRSKRATAKPEDRRLGDPGKEYWTMADIAAYLGVTVETVRVYRSRGRDELPEEDDKFGQSPVWKPATVIDHQRPGQGARTDLHHDDRRRQP
ncbi:sigma-70 region 4 domain-containing protein [Actinomadura madurae]|uniref:sigma-70 region 4 domain-containing protein n=1 Tax=Actinomadura madurae TaxID=1993 RepID=UPI0020D229F4|nr:sigma-70 region 4 domain-containing protein [Actinomadura madurae]MCP9947256.1 sigma-70 region 4 domain-containing protein [Actinomadura madurae]MCP9964017.1 sigma-70 region 4 domain-containing protein [Actinomadura madurae]MCP9976493.1 sigma-70 region 4 domain-containing protein [Actinomadura madurae]MCQ0012013.1 sigma-70 region 4 domain-containing protein [Actinomadura madurae]MCQ0012687.1 sigma-70 region 4 domain-containing protein [Actinomadura madurae]